MLNSTFLRRNLISKYSYMNRMVIAPAMNIHTFARSKRSLEDESPVLVYESKEFEELSQIPKDKWFKSITKSSYTKKYMELIPFFIESKYRTKNFVLKMELLPESEYLRFYTLSLGGVYEKYEPLKYFVPVARDDYRVMYSLTLFKQTPILDLDMIYGNYGSQHIYIFDKKGEWHDEGIEHEKLSLENTFNETNWFDEFTPERYF